MDWKDNIQRDLNAVAWRDFITFAWGESDAHDAFRAFKGWPKRPASDSPLDAMIDHACGAPSPNDDEYMREFIDWATETQWGTEFDPRPSPPHKEQSDET